MRYLMIVLPDAQYDAAKPIPKGIMEAIGPYVDRKVASGEMISTGWLQPTKLGARVNGFGGYAATVDGPFTEAKELVGGYAVFEAANQGAMLKLAAEFIELHIANGMPDITVEIREIEGGRNY